MIYDARHNCLRTIAKAVKATAEENALAHVYVKGWIVSILREYLTRDSFMCSYDVRATEDHIMRDVCAAIGETKRH